MPGRTNDGPAPDDRNDGGDPRGRTPNLDLALELPDTFTDLGITAFARTLGLTVEQTNGHWCSRCQGIWFGYTLETQCPVCGNRQG